MPILTVAIKVVSVLFELMHIAEPFFQDTPKSGGIKKSWVTDGAASALAQWMNLSSGGQKHTAESLADPIAKTIDIWAEVFFPKKEEEEA